MQWIMNLLGGTIFKVFGDSIMTPILNAWAKSKDINLETLKAKLGAETTEGTALLAHEAIRVAAQRDITLAAMNHKVWWVAWALFVLPVALYNAAIYAVSIFHAPIVIDRVPATQEAWAQLIVLSMFGLYATTSIVDGVLKAFAKK